MATGDRYQVEDAVMKKAAGQVLPGQASTLDSLGKSITPASSKSFADLSFSLAAARRHQQTIDGLRGKLGELKNGMTRVAGDDA